MLLTLSEASLVLFVININLCMLKESAGERGGSGFDKERCGETACSIMHLSMLSSRVKGGGGGGGVSRPRGI